MFLSTKRDAVGTDRSSPGFEFDACLEAHFRPRETVTEVAGLACERKNFRGISPP